MSEKPKPSCEELMDWSCVYREDDASWRHGAYVTQVFKHPEKDEFWQARYRLSSDGETNELREGIATITEVRPVQKTVTLYEDVK